MPRTNATLLLALSACAVVAGCDRGAPATPTAPSFSTGVQINTGSREKYTLAVIGDTPYGAAKLAELPHLVDAINGDPTVDLVAHLGDIKAGSNSPCTTAYFDTVKAVFDGFKDPFVYTPGDNEWTDCHEASKHNGLYTPTERLEAVRALFFPVPGRTLGGRKKRVLTEAHDPDNGAYVENTIWMEAQVVFAALNIPGSNNDLAPWGTPLPADAANYPSQAAEFASRARANRVWLDKAFAIAAENEAAGVVLLFQADMWDITSPLSGFDDLVRQIGTLAAAFGRPVLLLEGDSHVFRVDHPYSPDSPLFTLHPSTPVAENVTRLVVEGSAAGRTEYTRLTVDARGDNDGVFTWERVPLQ
jgi:hypothetical protein